MTVFPAIVRELRAQSRQPGTYGVRVLGALVLMATGVVFYLDKGLPVNLGGSLFAQLNEVLFLSIWIIAPLLTADCLSRERREGTLGLLFLTPLKPQDIVLAKGLVHGLRVLTLWLAVTPVLTIPFLLGGVDWRVVVFSVLLNFSALCWAVAAGLLGSAVSKAWLRALLTAGGLSLAGLDVFVLLAGCLATFASAGGSSISAIVANPDPVLQNGFYLVTNWHDTTAKMLSVPGVMRTAWLLGGMLVIGSLLLLCVAMEIAAWHLRRFWRDNPPSARQVWLEQTLFTPILWVSFLKRWSRHKLERNPIGWLEQRSWSGRLVTWSWFAIVISLISTGLSTRFPFKGYFILQNIMGWMLMGAMASAAAGSFQRERETGVLELLLVSPMKEWQIISGRLRGIWGQFLPGMVLFTAVGAYFGRLLGEHDNLMWVEIFSFSYLMIPVIGLYFSLRLKNFLAAMLAALVACFAVPFLVRRLLAFGMLWSIYKSKVSAEMDPLGNWDFGFFSADGWLGLETLYSPFFINFLQLIVAWAAARALARRLKQRNFAFTRGVN